MKKALYLFLVVFAISAQGQPAVEQAAPEADMRARSKVETSILSLESLYKSIQSKQGEIAGVQRELQSAKDEVTRGELIRQLTGLKEEYASLNQQFADFAVAVDTGVFSQEVEAGFNWQDELGAVVQPIIAELKSATTESRIINELRTASEEQGERASIADEAVANLEQLLASESTPELEERLRQELGVWTQRRDDARDQRIALELQLENRLAERKSMLDATTGYAKTFFQTRGLNLLLGIGSFCIVFFGLRFAGATYRKLYASRRGESFTSRLASLLMHFFSVLGGLVAALMVFNIVGDWFLMGIMIIFLLGIAWAGMKTLPQHIETVNLMLNVGPVKEGERIVFDGIPWRVDKLSFGVRLVNPMLDGGVQTMPIRKLVGLHSRPSGEHEEWFPTRHGDWVELGDGTFGRVSYQSPGSVQLTELGGSQVMLPTSDYLAASPRNLSTGFRVSTRFGIDYRHQADSTSSIPTIMQKKLEAGLSEMLGAENIRHLQVEFSEAGDSSLDYSILVDLDGASAAKYMAIRRKVSRLLVDACNEQGWEIPFPHVTVHRL
ncbi:MAG: mechanosensitive ion channel [Halioglobus sp.]|nr:mechanosensitive ion channel [Halioglobus sp.]